MNLLDRSNPVFIAYAVAASIMILKAVAMSWLTVVRMMQESSGFRAPEDLRKTPLNPSPRPAQLEPNERVERIRRIQQNDSENLPYFLVAGLLFVFTGPKLWVARALYYGYATTRLAHFVAYISARSHDLRAALWTPGSLIIVYMSVMALIGAFGS